MRTSGLRINSPDGDVVLPRVTATDDPRTVGPVDVVLFAVKLYDMESALQLLPQVIDQQNIPVQVNQQVASALFMQFVVAVQSGIAQAIPSMPVQRVEIAETTYDVKFFLKDGPTVIMNSLADANVQVRNLARLIQQKATQPTSTVDLRIDRWAYIHE